LAIVNTTVGKQYLDMNKKAGVTNATRLTYIKCLLKVLEPMKKRRAKMPGVPENQPGFLAKYDDAVVFWTDKRLKYGRKAIADRDEKLAKGENAMANLTHCFEYLADTRVQERAHADVVRIKAFARYRSPLVFGRRDNLDFIVYN